MVYQQRFRVQVAHDDDSHDAGVDPDGLWKRFLSSTNASKSFYVSLTRFAYLKRNGFLPAFFYYGPEGRSAKGDAGDWDNSGNLDTQNGEDWRGVSRKIDEVPWNSIMQGSFDVQTLQTFAIKKLVSNADLGHVWFKVSGPLFHLLCMDEVVRTAGDASGLDWRSYPVTTEDAFVVMVRYDGDGPMKHSRLYRWPPTDCVALYKDAKNDDVHALDEPFFRKLSNRPLVLVTKELLELKGVEVRSVDTGLRLWPKVTSLVLTRNDFETVRTYDPNMWTARQRHGFRNFKVTLSEPRL